MLNPYAMDIGVEDDDAIIVDVPQPARETNPYELPARPEVPAQPVEVPAAP